MMIRGILSKECPTLNEKFMTLGRVLPFFPRPPLQWRNSCRHRYGRQFPFYWEQLNETANMFGNRVFGGRFADRMSRFCSAWSSSPQALSPELGKSWHDFRSAKR